MGQPINIIERAYQIAKSGRSVELKDVYRQLMREGYESVQAHFTGPTIKRELRILIKEARGSGA